MKKIQRNTINLTKAKIKSSQAMWDLFMINKF